MSRSLLPQGVRWWQGFVHVLLYLAHPVLRQGSAPTQVRTVHPPQLQMTNRMPPIFQNRLPVPALQERGCAAPGRQEQPRGLYHVVPGGRRPPRHCECVLRTMCPCLLLTSSSAALQAGNKLLVQGGSRDPWGPWLWGDGLPARMRQALCASDRASHPAQVMTARRLLLRGWLCVEHRGLAGGLSHARPPRSLRLHSPPSPLPPVRCRTARRR